ncbi:MAG: serine hydrolase [Frankiales bacterium]|nr:serine hydrolase [Frankiales bacterium]
MIGSMTTDRRFLLLHGWENHRPPAHWQWWLAEQLRAQGEQVLYPQLPDADSPTLAAWTEVLHAELAQLGDGERVVVAHSLGVTLWLAAALTRDQQVDRVVLVSPPSPTVLGRYPEVEEFARAPLASGTADTRLVCSDNDPYCPEGATTLLAGLHLDTDVIADGGHLNPDYGYGAWPSMLGWCLDPATRITGRSGPA